VWIVGGELGELGVEEQEVFPGVMETQLMPGLRVCEVLIDGLGGFHGIDFHLEGGFFEGFGDGDKGGDLVLDLPDLPPGHPTHSKENQEEKVETEPEFFRERGLRQVSYRVDRKSGQGFSDFFCNHFRSHSCMVWRDVFFAIRPLYYTWDASFLQA